MTVFGRRPGDMFKSAYDADEDGVIDDGASHPHTHVHETTTEKGADDHTHYHTNNRGDARYIQLENLLVNWALADQYKQIIQGTWQLSNGSEYNWQTKIRNYSHDINDEIEYELFAQDGSRTFEIFILTGPTSCIISVYLDDVLQGTIDTWSNPLVTNVYATLPVTVVNTAKHSVKLKAASKNVFSANYYMYVTWIRIK